MREVEVVVLDSMIYDGSQLESLWVRKRTRRQGDVIGFFLGPCDVSTKMIDLEDVEMGHHIKSNKMLHFLIEIFDQHPSMELATTRQRLFTACVYEELVSCTDKGIRRDGDDIFISDDKGDWLKLSVSIATISLQSTLIHFAMNTTIDGTPSYVQCGSLEMIYRFTDRELIHDIGGEIANRFKRELEGIAEAASGKVLTK